MGFVIFLLVVQACTDLFFVVYQLRSGEMFNAIVYAIALAIDVGLIFAFASVKDTQTDVKGLQKRVYELEKEVRKLKNGEGE